MDIGSIRAVMGVDVVMIIMWFMFYFLLELALFDSPVVVIVMQYVRERKSSFGIVTV